RIGAGALDHARDLMAQRERQYAAFTHIERFAFAEREIAVLHVQVGMTDAAALDAYKHLAALRLRTIDNGFAKRGLIGGQREAAKFRHVGTLPRMILSENRFPPFRIMRPLQRRGRGQRNHRSGFLPPARSARCRPRRAAAAVRMSMSEGSAAAFFVVDRTPPR